MILVKNTAWVVMMQQGQNVERYMYTEAEAPPGGGEM